MIDHNHPAVEAARRALASDDENGCMIKRLMQGEQAMRLTVIACAVILVGVLVAALVAANARPDYTGPVRVADLSYTPARMQSTVSGNRVTTTPIPDSHRVLLCPTNGSKCWQDSVDKAYWSSLEEGQILNAVNGRISN